MNEKKMKKHPLRWALLAMIVVAAAAGFAFSHYGGFGTIAGKRVVDDMLPQTIQMAGH